MSCLARLGCLILIVGLGVGAWLTRDRWLHRGQPVVDSAASEWSPLSEDGAKRTAGALATLSSSSGPVFVTASGADVASYVFLQLAKSLPASSDSFAARVGDDKISLRASMKTSELGSVLGALGSLLGDRERVELGGSLRVIGKGVAEFIVSDVSVGGVALPSAVISRLIAPRVQSKRPPGLDANALPLSIPSYIGDVRVANGKITLYKNVQ
jgi:hypothetical protein